MKQQSGLKLTIIAIVCGIIAAALTVFYLKQIETKYRKASEPVKQATVAVVVPKANLKKGSVITAKSVAARNIPKAFIPSNAIMATDFKKLVNRTLLMPLQKGRPITWEAVTGKSAKTFSENIELGRRARSVKVNKIDSFDGLLRPGDHIDLMGDFTLSVLGLDSNAPASTTNPLPEDIIMPILENVEVLAAGKEDLYGRKYEYTASKKSVDGFNMEFTIVSLNLTPKQIARVELAEGVGGMFAVLRHPKDTSMADFDYVGIEILLEKDKPENIDLVIGANGKAIGRIVGDNVVDENGNIVGKIVNGKAVSFDGKSLGTIIQNVDENDPILNVAEVVDVVRDANGNIIGKIVDGKIIDANGNIVGEIKDGKAVSMTGKIIGTVEKNVALDVNGNEIDLSSSVAAEIKKSTHTEQIVRDASGKIIGKVVNGQVIDADGNVIGKVTEDGQVQGLDGKNLGVIETVLVDGSGKILAVETEVVRDTHGNVIGRVVNGQIIDEDGSVVGTVDESGKAVGLNGEVLGSVETVLLDDSGKVMASVSEVVRDSEGKIVGRVVNGEVIDLNGNVIGKVKSDGSVVGLNGESLGTVEKVVTDVSGRIVDEAVEVVRDAQGNVIGKIIDGKVVDATGKIVGVVKNGQVIDMNGNVIAENVAVSFENPNVVTAEAKTPKLSANTAGYIDFISGGTAKDGIVPVVKIRKE